MRYIYAQLLQAIKHGEEAIIVTACRTDGIAHTLHTGDAALGWDGKRGTDDSLYMEKNAAGTVIVERFLPRSRMFIFGAGHIAVPLAHVASMLDFDVVVYDDRPAFANSERFPDASEVVCESFGKVGHLVKARASDYAVILTRGHKHDEDCLRAILDGTPPYYVGMIGSRRRVAIVRRQMKDEGFAPELVDRVHSPIGLAIGAVTPEEIVISILAEVVKERRMKFSWDGGGSAAARSGASSADMDLLEWLAGEDSEGALVTILSTEGSTPREAGAKMIVTIDGAVGTIGGGCAEAGVLRDARDIIREGGYMFKTIDISGSADEDGMVCGGKMTVLIEAVSPHKCRAD
ncbi:MAG: XdhC family protein [Synergistaceae bacterium]|jgi:xanthine dehydrogenase accessory factor|nr:XdhC family protein [Synergistaceae bacterium]